MNAKEQKKPYNKKTVYWSFCALEFMPCFSMTDKDAGKLFKQVLQQLSTENVPEDSIAFPMFKRTQEYRDRQRERVMNRWNRNNGEADDSDAPDESTTFSNAYAGRNGLVRLTDDDYAAILQAVGNKREADRLIDSLDNSIAEGKVYRSRHLNVLLYWNDYRQDKAREAAELKKVEAEARAEANARHGYKTAADRMDEMVKGAKHLIALNSLKEVIDG